MAEQLYPKEIVEDSVSIRNGLIERIVALPAPAPESAEAADLPEDPYENLRFGLWGAARELDQLLDDAFASCVEDLTREDLDFMRQLYAVVVERHFMPHALDDQGFVYVPRFTPEQCKLEIIFQYGRWMATWLKLEGDMSRPECEHRELIGFEWDERKVLVFVEI
jgi:hypothetical protein